MELDAMRNLARTVKAPPIATGRGASDEFESLLATVRTTDARDAGRARAALPLFGVAAILFSLGAVATLAGAGPGSRTGHYAILATVFLLNTGLLARKLGQIRRVDYSAPVRTFLVQTERRYRLVGLQEFVYAVPLLLTLGVTGGLVVVDMLVPRHVGWSHLTTVIAGYIVCFLAVCAAGSLFTYLDWKRDKGPVFEEIRQMRHALESNGDQA